MKNQTITRADIVDQIVNNLSVSRQQASGVLESLLDVIGQALVNGKQVKISSFGTFNVRQKGERLGRNPRTGESARISPRKVVSFKASPLFKREIDGAGEAEPLAKAV
jgi:integration host factor subunit alpha